MRSWSIHFFWYNIWVFGWVYTIPFCDEPSSGHLGQPVVVWSACPVFRVVLVCQREHGYFVTFAMQFLHKSVIGVLVRHEERSFDRATVWIHTVGQRVVEYLLVQIHVVHVDGSVERDGDQLWYLKPIIDRYY